MFYKHLMVSLGFVVAFLPACSNEGQVRQTSAAPAQNIETLRVRFDADFTQRQTLTGQVEANRRSDVGFELPGTLAAVQVDEGDTVDQGQALATLATERLSARRDESDARLAQARTAAILADSTFARVEEAVSFNGVSQQEFDQASNNRANARAAVAAARARRQSIDVDIAKSTLKAPFDAVITARHADEGQVVAAGQSVLSLQERSNLTVRIGVAGPALNTLAPGTSQTLLINDSTVDATVRQRLPQRDRVSRTVDVLLDLPWTDQVRVGDLARLDVSETINEAGVWLPLDALAEGARGLWTVYVAVADGNIALGATHKVQPRPVNIIYQTAGRAYVNGALETDDEVVVSGLQRIVPGQYVRLLETAAAQ